MGTLLWNLVAIASWLAEVGAATLLWLAGGPAALLWVLECGCLVQCFNRLVVATVLWVADRGYHGTVGNGMRLPWCSGEQSVVVMVAEYRDCGGQHTAACPAVQLPDVCHRGRVPPQSSP